MKLRYDEETEAFRAELGGWLDANRPSEDDMAADPSLSTGHITGWARAWQSRLFDAGWLVPGWPPELGGRNATPIQQMVFFEELARRGLRRSENYTGITIVAPSILDYGTDEQREHFVLPILKGEIATCLGMSEPGAGSDLAGLSTRAELFDDHFVVNGQKVWTSGAHHADLCFCFVRTDPDAPKHKGISVLLIDMHSPGIACRPLPNLHDREGPDFNEVFFDDVMVPRDRLLGELNQGWVVANGSLAHERAIVWIDLAVRLEREVSQLVDETRQRGSGAVLRDRMAAHYIDAQALKFLGYRGFAKYTRGRSSPEHSILKLFGSEAAQALTLTALESIGPAAMTIDGAGKPADELSWTHLYFRTFPETIAGGSSEIQRNIISERILGLPRR
ncbi:MAG: acyl-CoA dehydrogenase [Actinobacteria bacterium]|nr:MAG: acyl-CoA dehydrogenase [Actinomycetota bacterium]